MKSIKKAEYLKHREKYIARAQKVYEENKAAKREYDREYRRKNADKLLALKAIWREKNAEKVRDIKSSYKKRNPHMGRADAMKRHARKKNAEPKWLTESQKVEILAIYEEASKRPGGPWHVDHIVPLAGKTVCGLHVPWNLRIITVHENVVKHNKLIPELAERHTVSAAMLE